MQIQVVEWRNIEIEDLLTFLQLLQDSKGLQTEKKTPSSRNLWKILKWTKKITELKKKMNQKFTAIKFNMPSINFGKVSKNPEWPN